MSKPQCYIFDIDGTLADNSHRSHWVRTKPKNWPAYNKDMAHDAPIHPVLDTLHALTRGDELVIICSGREEIYKEVTINWLDQCGVNYDKLYMRKAKDYRDDCDVKREMLKEIQQTYDVIAVFDDRTKMVQMWRDEGLYVFDCNQTREVF